MKLRPYIKITIHIQQETIMYEILQGLYLCNFQEAQACTGHAFIVNCTKDLPMVRDIGIRIPVDDNGAVESLHAMYMCLPFAVQQIDEALRQNIPVVVHCLAGQQRSPAVVCAYLMKTLGWTLEESIRYVRQRKPDAFFWSVNFKDSLVMFHALLQG